MTILLRKTGVAALAGLTVLALAASPVQAGVVPGRPNPALFFRPNPTFFAPHFGMNNAYRQGTLGVYSPGVSPQSPFYNPLTPNYRVAPGTSWQQAMYNTYANLYAASRLPPWMFGYNPYPAPVIVSPNPYAGSMYNPYSTPYFNPYAYPTSSFYGPAYGVGANPYAATLSPFSTGSLYGSGY